MPQQWFSLPDADGLTIEESEYHRPAYVHDLGVDRCGGAMEDGEWIVIVRAPEPVLDELTRQPQANPLSESAVVARLNQSERTGPSDATFEEWQQSFGALG